MRMHPRFLHTQPTLLLLPAFRLLSLADMWALGCIMAELVNLRPLFHVPGVFDVVHTRASQLPTRLVGLWVPPNPGCNYWPAKPIGFPCRRT